MQAEMPLFDRDMPRGMVWGLPLPKTIRMQKNPEEPPMFFV
jgi:hypothetical protein